MKTNITSKQFRVFYRGLMLLCLLTAAVSANAAEILLIAHPSVTVTSLDRTTIAKIYLGHKTTWDNSATIRVVLLKAGSTHEAFTRDVIRITPARLKNLWKKVVFTGTGTPPKILKTEEDVVEFVAETEGAIGYIDASTPHHTVRPISIEK